MRFVKCFLKISLLFLVFLRLLGGDLLGWALKETDRSVADGVGQGAAWYVLDFGLVIYMRKFPLGVV